MAESMAKKTPRNIKMSKVTQKNNIKEDTERNYRKKKKGHGS